MALSKKIENIVIGLDPKFNQLKILRNNGKNHKNLSIEHLAYEPDFYKDNLFELLDNLISYHLKYFPAHTADAFVVLPNHFVFTQTITLPIMPAARLNLTLKAELERVCPKSEEYSIATTLIHKSKTNVVYFAVMVKQSILEACIKACKKNGLNLRGISYSANCTLNSFLALSEGKLQDFMFLDIKETESTLIYAAANKTSSFFTLPIGQNFLSAEEINVLANFKNVSDAQKDVFNALGANAYNITFSGATVAEIEKNAFSYFKSTFLNTQKQQEEMFFKENPTISALSANFSVMLRYVAETAEYVNRLVQTPPRGIVVNLPKHLQGAISNQKNDVPISLLKSHLTEKCLISDYLDLYGALFMNTYNKTQNFDLKIKSTHHKKQENKKADK